MSNSKEPEAMALDDSALDGVAGGAYNLAAEFASEGQVEYLYQVNDQVFVKGTFGGSVLCTITERRCVSDCKPDANGNSVMFFVDQYYCESNESHWWFINGWMDRDQIVANG